ncbi:LYR motif-containing protein 4 [Aethina tumida]|uniref:LYR motif-containing protein 4 n=1 Tax=Aethina tumida TaxID=116153 RepID=UPI00096B0436|nr:LYR motif-containing protein 4 [Aethina tumida]
MSNLGRNQVLGLYRSLIKESKKIPAYNFRNYALRKVRDSFKENKTLTDPKVISEQIADAERNLEVIKRQALIGQMYNTDKLVIETISVSKR